MKKTKLLKLGWLALVTIVTTNIHAQSACFTSNLDQSAKGLIVSRAIEKGDFDNDGIKDIISATFQTGVQTVNFSKGNSNGTFAAPVSFNVIQRIADLKAADLNNDGNLDFVSAAANDSKVIVSLGNGNGTFQAGVSYNTSVGPLDLAISDFNEDGVKDLAVATNTGNIEILLGVLATPGTFSSAVLYATASNARGVVAADFNGDMHIDLAVTSNAAAKVSVFYGAGNGTFGARTDYATQTDPYKIVAGDVNADGKLDLVCSNEFFSTTDGSFSVFLNNGATFGAATHFSLLPEFHPDGINLGDFNGDSKLDVVVVTYGGSKIQVFQGSGTGNFTLTSTNPANTQPRDIVVFDANSDGKLDVVSSTDVGGKMPVFLGLGNGNFKTVANNFFPVGNAPLDLCQADFNGDGKKDIAAVNSNDNNVQLLIGAGDGTFTSGGVFTTGTKPVGVRASDFNADGKQDLAVINETDKSLSILLGNGLGSFAPKVDYPCGSSFPRALAIEDIDGDADKDVVIGSSSDGTNTRFNYFKNNGSAIMTGTLNVNIVASATTDVGGIIGYDCDNDSDKDFAVTCSDGKVRILRNPGTGILAVYAGAFNVGTGPKGIDVADMNADGFQDLVVANYTGNTLTILKGAINTGNPIYTTHATLNQSGMLKPVDAEFEDFNNDGKIDIFAIYEENITSNGDAAVFMNAGPAAYTFNFYSQFGQDIGPKNLVVGDWDNDGRIDLASVNSVSNTVTVMMNTTAVISPNGAVNSCSSNPTALTAISSDFYNWSNGATTQSIAPNTAGFYSVTSSEGFWCSSTSATATITILPGPTLTLTDDLSICSSQSTTLTVSGANSYTWSDGLGTNTSVSVSPSVTKKYYVTGTSSNGCTATDSVTVTVISSPNATFNTLASSYCQSSSAVTLIPVQTGGTFSGSGVSGTTFTPSTLPTGPTSVTYTIDLGGGCSATTTQNTTINAAPNAAFSGLAATYCTNNSAVTLTPTQTGGTFSGPGISGNTFNPNTAGAGTHTITYSITLGGCTTTSTSTTVVTASPVATFGGLAASYCANETSATLTPTQSGGTFSGSAGLSGLTFNPATASIGTNTVTYTITVSGCTSTSTQTTNVIAMPNASFSGLTASYCANAAVVTLTPTTTGGTFSGSTGLSGFTFNPATASIGSNSITYTVSASGCSSSSTQITTVNALPNATYSVLAASYCSNASSVTLTPTTAGGTFSGSTGLSGSTFNPATASIGTNTVLYSVTVSGCSASSTQTTIVNALPNATFSGLAASYCSNASSVTLTPTTLGGTFSGSTGLSGSTFNPATASIGSNTITYSLTVSGCTSSTTQTTTVNAVPNASFTGLGATYCANASSVTLTPTTAGGTFSGSTGLSGSTFNPATASIGSNTILYSLTVSGCSASSTQTTTVNALPNATFSGLAASYCSNASSVTLTPTTAGGIFSGSTGLSGSTFNPATASIGSNTISYTVSVSGCSANSTQTTTVNALPNATFSGLAASYCSNTSSVTLTPTTAGGTFSGSTGLSGSTFNPATASIGSNSITYTVSVSGCSANTIQTTTVTAAPNANFTGLAANYCVTGATVTLTPTTTGGTFSGSTGLSGSTFNPATASIGTNSITYTVSASGCSANTTQTTTVNALPNATFSGLAASYCEYDAIVTLIPSTAGGTFSGPGISGNTFSPSIAGAGNNQSITYTVTVNGCTNSSSALVDVKNAPDPSFTLNTSYCSTDAPTAFNPVKIGGTFTGSTGISGTNFDPTTASIGSNAVTYTVSQAGCTSSLTLNTTVNATPSAAFSGLAATYCTGGTSSTLVPTVAGGTFSGSTGLSGSTFNPATASLGSNTVIYNITVSGCSNSSSTLTTVNASPDATFSGLSATYCSADASVVLTPNTTGGSFSGSTGLSGSTFNPATASIGSNTVTYAITAGNGCTSTSTQNATVNATPSAAFSGLAATYCTGGTSSTLVPTVAGGTFSGSTGLSGSTFNPATASLGSNTVIYNITVSGCSNSSSTLTTVNASPDATFSGLSATYCSADASVVLTPNTTGGSFSGSTGLSGTNFNPSTANIGSNTVTYTITAGNGCTSTSTQNATVNATPSAAFSGLAATYCTGGTLSTLVPTVAGGTFSGSTGLSGSTFNPATASLGSNTVIYNITVSGCSNSSTATTTVNLTPNATFTGLAATYCSSNPSVILTPNTTGGSFTGSTGLSGSNFNPATASIGSNTVTYTVTQAACTSTSTQTTVVGAPQTLSFTGLSAVYCESASSVVLTPNITGGTFSGSTGLSGSTFNPANAAIGLNTITYTLVSSGCTNVVSNTTTVNASPDATFSGLAASYCTNASSSTLVGSTPGGNFTGSTGLSGSNFNPASASIGANSITYTVTANGCTSSTSQSTNVLAIPNATFTGLASSYCSNSAPVTLTPITTGGIFSGNGVTGSVFQPAAANIGNNLITYTVTVGSCSNSYSTNTVINAAPNATFTGLAASYCSNAGISTLTPNTTGGTFSGSGISGSTFNPAIANIGSNTITYTITVGGCTSTSSQTTNISAAPNATFTGLASTYCSNASSVTLSPSTAGGTFTGSGITGSTFNPSSAAIGSNVIVYSINVGGCTNTSTQVTNITAAPNASFTGLNATYCSNDNPISLTPSVAGGTFSGSGIVGNTFDPSNAFIGANNITYTINQGGCTNSSSQTTNVNAAPSATFTGLAANYCTNDATVTLSPSQTGGTFTGAGISGYTFNPALASIGANNITYTITSGGCSSTHTESTNIGVLPDATFAGLNNSYCQNASLVTLTPNVTGGTFTGNGISGNTFDPSLALVGSNTINYTITSNGCTNVSSLNVDVLDIPNATFTGLNPEYCNTEAGSLLIPNTTGGTFSGNGLTAGNVFEPSMVTPGSYSISYAISGSNGCSNSTTQNTIVYDMPATTVTLANGSTLMTSDAAGANVTYQWKNCGTGLIVPGATSQSFSPSVNGSYAVIVSNGACTTISNCFDGKALGVDENEMAMFTYYPNPSKGIIHFEAIEELTLKLFDGAGKLIDERKVYVGENEIDYKQFVVPGMYRIHVQGANTNKVVPVIFEN